MVVSRSQSMSLDWGHRRIGPVRWPCAGSDKGWLYRTQSHVSQSWTTTGNPSAKELAQIIVSIGLAQNCGPQSLVSTGIQQRPHEITGPNPAYPAEVLVRWRFAPSLTPHRQDFFNLETAQQYLSLAVLTSWNRGVSLKKSKRNIRKTSSLSIEKSHI